MRQALDDRWTIDIDEAFTRRVEDDSHVFDNEGLRIWADVYWPEALDSEQVIRDWLDGRKQYDVPVAGIVSELQFDTSEPGIVGRAVIVRNTGKIRLLGAVASYGRLAEIRCSFTTEDRVDEVLRIWRSLRAAVPPWVVMCAESDPPLVKLPNALEGPLWVDIRLAAEDIQQQGQVQKATGILLAALRDHRPIVRQKTCDAFRYLGNRSPEVMSSLRSRLYDNESVDVQSYAAQTLLAFGEPPQTVVPPMVERLRDEEGRYHAARILACVGEAARPARDLLLQHLMDKSGFVRCMVAEALNSLGEPVSAIVAALLDGLRSPHMTDRELLWMARALIGYGVSAGEVLPVVSRVLTGTSDRGILAEALDIIDEVASAAQSTGAAVKAAMNNTGVSPSYQRWVRVRVAQTLLRISVDTGLAAPIVLEALRRAGTDAEWKASLLTDLGRADSLDRHILAGIAQFLDDEADTVRLVTACVLGKNGEAIGRVLPMLIAALDDPDPRKRWNAIAALSRMGSQASQAVPRLIQCLREETVKEVRLVAIWTLGRIAGQQEQVVSVLREIAQGGDEDIRRCVAESLWHPND